MKTLADILPLVSEAVIRDDTFLVSTAIMEYPNMHLTLDADDMKAMGTFLEDIQKTLSPGHNFVFHKDDDKDDAPYCFTCGVGEYVDEFKELLNGVVYTVTKGNPYDLLGLATSVDEFDFQPITKALLKQFIRDFEPVTVLLKDSEDRVAELEKAMSSALEKLNWARKHLKELNPPKLTCVATDDYDEAKAEYDTKRDDIETTLDDAQDAITETGVT